MMSVCMDKLWAKQEDDNAPAEKRRKQAEALGNDLRQLVKKNLGIDTHDFYK